jgi:DNA-binding NarL/FixJ family response regulator
MKIALAEDNVYSLQALLQKLALFDDVSIVHTTQNGKELIEALTTNNDVDLILMDIEMPEMDGIQATSIVKNKYPHIKVIMITVFDDDASIFNAIKAGANSYILKETKADKIYETMQDTLQGGSVMSPSIAFKTLALLKNASVVLSDKIETSVVLSERETEILNQISQGFTNKRIAENLFISPFTVKRHIENIYQKLQAHNRIELMEKARQSGLVN